MRYRLGTVLAALALALAPLPAAAAQGGVPADSARLHLYVHYDYMVEADGTSYAPDPDAIDLVRQAFDLQGIDLQIDPDHAAIPAHSMINFFGSEIGTCPAAADTVQFDDLKRQYYRPTSNHPWKYAIFGTRINCFGNTGIADINGDDFVVALGQLNSFLLRLPRDNRLRFEGGTFMHELGHTLGLDHGGLEPINNKPNYLSVMNYSFQTAGIPFAATFGSVAPAGRRVDYSHQALAALDESDLDETVGIDAGTKDITVFNSDFGFGVGPATGAIDWNLNGDASDRHVVSNLNANYDLVLERLSGFDDWSYVRGVLRGTIERGPRRLESHDMAHRPEVLAIDPESGTSLGGTEVRIHGRHLGQVDGVSFGNVKAASFRIEDDDAIVAVAPPGAGTVHVNVASAGNPSPTTTADLFTYLQPILHEIIPASGLPGASVTVKGERLASTTDVLFVFNDGSASHAQGFTVVDDNTIVVTTPYVDFGGFDRSSQVTVVTRDYGRNELHTAFIDPAAWGELYAFVTSPRPAPVITSITPSTGPAGTNVTIMGSGFRFFFGGGGCCEQSAGLVAFGGMAASNVAIWSDDRITANAPAGAGSVDVRVFSIVGRSPVVPGDLYTYPLP